MQLKTEDKELTVINAGGNAVQTFCHKGNDWYLVQRISNKVVVTKRPYKQQGRIQHLIHNGNLRQDRNTLI